MTAPKKNIVNQPVIDDSAVQAFLHRLPGLGLISRQALAEDLFDFAQTVLDTATDMTPHYRGRLTASILQFGIRDSGNRRARRGKSLDLKIAARTPYAEFIHDGAYFLGLGRQPKVNVKAKRKRTRRKFTVVSGRLTGQTAERQAFVRKGSMAKNDKTGEVGYRFFPRAIEKHSAKFGASIKKMVPAVFKKLVEQAAAKSRGRGLK